MMKYQERFFSFHMTTLYVIMKSNQRRQNPELFYESYGAEDHV